MTRMWTLTGVLLVTALIGVAALPALTARTHAASTTLPEPTGRVHAASTTLYPRARVAVLASDPAPVAPPPPAAPAAAAVAPAAAVSSWLSIVNAYREASHESDLSENTAWDAGELAHSQYMALNNVIGHSEDPSLPYYSADGNTAAGASNVYLGYGAGDATTAINGWLTGPFHAVGILDPQLQQTAFGLFRSGNNWGASLDVIRGLVYSSPATLGYPIEFPGNGATTTLGRYIGNESPDPLTSCPGYAAPTGLPIMLMLGPGSGQPPLQGTVQSVTANGAAVDYCTFDSNTYVNPDSGSQTVSRQILSARGAIVIIPRSPLTPGATYTVSVATANGTITWSFTVSPSAS